MLKKFRSLTHQYALLSAVAVGIFCLLSMYAVSWFFSLLPDSTPVKYLEEFFCMLYPALIVVLFGFSSAFRSKNFFRGLLCGSSMIVLQLFMLVSLLGDAFSKGDAVWKPWGAIILGLVSMLTVGVREECFFRGTIQNILTKKYAHSVKGMWIAAIVSALIFGLVHAANILSGVLILPAIIQSIANVGIGLFFAALYLRTANLWVLISIHTLIDIVGLFGSIFFYQKQTEIINTFSWSSLIAGIVFTGVAIFLLRPSKCKEILSRVQAEFGKESLEASAEEQAV